MANYNFQPLRGRIKDIEDWLSREFASIRTGRPTPALLDGVTVEVYGNRSSLAHIAAITVADPRSLKITLWDKNQTKAVESALAAANLGDSFQNEQTAIRVIFPELTQDKRKLLIKLAHEKAEEARISLRQERDHHWSAIQEETRAGTLSEDDKFRLKNELQKLIDEANKELDAAFKRKEVEINA